MNRLTIDPIELSYSDIIRFKIDESFTLDLLDSLSIPDEQIQLIDQKYDDLFSKTIEKSKSKLRINSNSFTLWWDKQQHIVMATTIVNDGSHVNSIYNSVSFHTKNSKHNLLLMNLSKLFNSKNKWEISNLNFRTIAIEFNAAANQVNQILHLDDSNKIQMSWKSDRPKIPVPKVLSNNHSMIGLPHDIDDLPDWVHKIKYLEDQGITLNDIRDHPDKEIKALYGMRSDYIRKELIVLHECRHAKHTIFPYELIHHINQWITDLESGRNRFDKHLHADFRFINFGKNPKTNNMITSKDGDIFLRCACVDVKDKNSFDLDRCSVRFNLKDKANLDRLKNILSKTPMEYKDRATKLLDLINEIISSDLAGYHRIYSNCIHCGYKNINQEAVLNETGENTKLKHAADINCQSCHKDYCADCLKEHPGIICRGFRQGEVDDVGAIACPGCRVPIHRSSGCAFMVCKGKCKRMFCWSCRSLRHDEGSDRQHYCLLVNSFQANQVWTNDVNVITYTSESPV